MGRSGNRTTYLVNFGKWIYALQRVWMRSSPLCSGELAMKRCSMRIVFTIWSVIALSVSVSDLLLAQSQWVIASPSPEE